MGCRVYITDESGNVQRTDGEWARGACAGVRWLWSEVLEICTQVLSLGDDIDGQVLRRPANQEEADRLRTAALALDHNGALFAEAVDAVAKDPRLWFCHSN